MIRLRHSVLVGALLAVATVLVVGCSAESTISRSEYVQRVNDLCRATTTQIDQSLTPVIEEYIATLGGAMSTDEEVMGLYAAVLPVSRELNRVFEGMLADVRSLPNPDEGSEAFSDHWGRVEALWRTAFADLETASTDGEAAQSLLAEPDPRLTSTNSEAVTLGVGECVFD